MSDSDYSSNNNKIFKNNDLKLNMQMSVINQFIIYLNSESSNETDNKNENNKLFLNNTLINCINCHSQSNGNSLIYELNNILSTAKFNILQYSLILLSNN